MDFYYLKRSLLFDGCTQEEIQHMLTCFGAEERTYKKGQVIWPSGRAMDKICLILEGSVRTEHTDPWGHVSVLMISTVGKTFGEAYACAPAKTLMLDFVANEDSLILMMDAHRVMHRCHQRCPYHLQVATNLTELIALRNLNLSRRSYILAHKSIRGKVQSFLSLQATEQDAMEFDIPYNRDQLASYLGVDRSALSSELSRMQKAGLIEFRKNHFLLKQRTDVI